MENYNENAYFNFIEGIQQQQVMLPLVVCIQQHAMLSLYLFAMVGYIQQHVMLTSLNYSLWKIIMKTPILILLKVFSSSRLCYHWLYVFNSMRCYHSLYLFAMVGYIQQHVMLTIAVFIYYYMSINY